MFKKIYVVAALTIALASCKTSQNPELGEGLFANIQTSKGDIIVRLEHEKTPVTVANFISLAEGTSPFVSENFKGKKYYDGLIFHRVMKDFMIQGGCPNGTGMGNPGYRFMDEFNDSLIHDRKGLLSSANSGPATNGSQFFITHKPTPWLDGVHTIFGEVVEGIAVVDSIANVPVGTGNKPVDSVSMNTVQIIRNGKEAKKFDAVQIMTDYFDNEEERLAALEKEKAEKMAAMKGMMADFATELEAQAGSAKQLPSGLKMLVLQEGDGEKPKIGQQVEVMYAGYLPDGSLFESNFEEVAKKYGRYDERKAQGGAYMPAPMTYATNSGLVAGFEEGLLSMKVGDKVRLFIPAHLGWGAQGAGPIPPNSDVIFDVELTGIK
ncbi:peptidylprolyl isomerase [Maribacter chungangensis]|uniref:peptidylprolyl isomerase n=1 Tax=Maribacter chungangensis TaxID=1069117 RepID=A0ABW3B696_9FLAO